MYVRCSLVCCSNVCDLGLGRFPPDRPHKGVRRINVHDAHSYEFQKPDSLMIRIMTRHARTHRRENARELTPFRSDTWREAPPPGIPPGYTISTLLACRPCFWLCRNFFIWGGGGEDSPLFVFYLRCPLYLVPSPHTHRHRKNHYVILYYCTCKTSNHGAQGREGVHHGGGGQAQHPGRLLARHRQRVDR